MFKFHTSKDLRFTDIDYSFLKGYVGYLQGNGNKQNTIGLYLRTLRALYNLAIKEGYANSDRYPFKSKQTPNGYSVEQHKAETRKRAISLKEMKKFKKFDASSSHKLQLAKDLFIFSYHVRGINFVDILHLKWSDVNGERIEYHRIKTRKTSFFTINILEPVREIIERYRKADSEYIFPLLDESKHITPRQIKDRHDLVLKEFNKALKYIGKEIGLEYRLTSYVARHSYASHLKQKGEPDSVIGDQMKHRNGQVTKTYLANFGDDVLDEADKKLL